MNAVQLLSKSARQGFSLLEVIIATAVLAGSAMVLVSMIGAGSRYGQLAERRTLALAAACSLIDELIATNKLASSNQAGVNQETTGVYGTSDPLGYRIRVSPFAPQTENQSEPISGLQQITVEIFPSELRPTDDQPKAICTLTRIVRVVNSNPSAEIAQPTSQLNGR